ncbi:MAG: hypothetical protein ABIR12_02260, partial [Ilumatobacteraceae bacterium]
MNTLGRDMKSKKLILGLAAAGLLISACGSSSKSAATTTPAASTVDCKPVKPGVLSVVTSLPGPNFWGSSGGEIDPTK